MPPSPGQPQPACQRVILRKENKPVRARRQCYRGRHSLRVPTRHRCEGGGLRHQCARRIAGVIVDSQAELPASGGHVVAQTLNSGALRERDLLRDQPVSYAGITHAQYIGFADGDRA